MKPKPQLMAKQDQLQISGRESDRESECGPLLEVSVLRLYGPVQRFVCWKFGSRRFHLFANDENALWLQWLNLSADQRFNDAESSREDTLQAVGFRDVRRTEASVGDGRSLITELGAAGEATRGNV
jgi:hypothetical protein